MRKMDIQFLEIGILEELLHQVRRARAFRADPDRRAAQIGKSVKGIARSSEKQKGFRFGEPTKELEPSISRHRRAVLDEGEFLSAPSPSIGQAANVLDSARGGYDHKGTVLALGPVSQARGQRVILASRRARENRRVQVAIVVSYAEC